MIAPFWSDVDTRLSHGDKSGASSALDKNDVDETGNVWFREEYDEQLLLRAQREIREVYVDHSNFVPSWLFITTWDAVGYYLKRTDQASLSHAEIHLIIISS